MNPNFGYGDARALAIFSNCTNRDFVNTGIESLTVAGSKIHFFAREFDRHGAVSPYEDQ